MSKKKLYSEAFIVTIAIMRNSTHWRLFPLLLLLLSLHSCAIIEGIIFSDETLDLREGEYSKLSEQDYVHHYKTLQTQFFSTPENRCRTLNGEQQRYLESIAYRIIRYNELLIKAQGNPHFCILESSVPLYFSFPDGEVVLSTALLKKYVRNEAELLFVMAYELLRSYRYIYPGKVIVPKGYLQLERVVPLLRLPIEVRMELNQWVYYILRRSGYDPYATVLWIQQLNRNALDFLLLLGDTQAVTREEYNIKNFILKNKFVFSSSSRVDQNSSSEFYRFIHTFKN